MRLVAAAASVLFLAPAVARAHGGNPQTQEVLFAPDGSLVVVATFGVLYGEPGGAFDWVCPEAIPGGRAGVAPPSALAPDGALIFATTAGVVRGEPSGCAWSYPSTELEGTYVADVLDDPSTGALLALESESSGDNTLFTSDDGLVWAPTGAPLPEGFLPERVRVAPSSAATVYVSGAYPEGPGTPRRAAVFRSTTRAAGWVERPFTLAEGERDLLLLDVDPADPDRVVAWVRGEVHDRVVASDDGGATFVDLDVIDAAAGTRYRPFGYARAADGTLYYGNTESGLYENAAGVSTSLDKNLAVACLRARGDVLWICGDGTDDGFAVARAGLADLATYEPIVEFDAIAAPRACTPDGVCEDLWDDLLTHLGRADGGVDGGITPADGSAGDLDAGIDGGSRRDAGRARDGGAARIFVGGGGGCTVTRATCTDSAHERCALVLTILLALFSAGRSVRRR